MGNRTVAALHLITSGLLATCCIGGCGPGQTVAGPSSSEPQPPPATATVDAPPSSELVTAAGSASTSTFANPRVDRPEVGRLFADLARALTPLPVYGLTELPPEASIPAMWWPAVSVHSPDAHNGPQVANPWVSDSPAGTQEAQVLLKMGEGWLVIIENFRGDLGDVRGSPAGNVAGRPATLYEFADGSLVHWSDQGAWYGVFGRGVDAADVLGTALSLIVIAPTD